LLALARKAAGHAYAPYSRFAVGAALRFADGGTVSAGNVENASYGLSLCAETLAVAKALADGRRGGLRAIAVAGRGDEPITPCGRCRQVLHELAGLDGADPVIWCAGDDSVLELRLSELLPHAFGPGRLDGA
jgi:cytidine deaminase